MASLEEALRALGFTKKGRDKPAAPEPTKKKKDPSQVEVRKRTEGELSVSGLNDHAASFQSPIAHAARDILWGITFPASDATGHDWEDSKIRSL